MASDCYLKLDNIKGESTDDKHKDEIDILNFSWGVTQTGSPIGTTGAGSGSAKVTPQDLHFTHYVDKASPDLLKVCITGKHIPTGTLTVRKAGDKPLEYLKYELKDIMVTGVSTSGQGGDTIATETISLSFASFKMTYTPQKADGSGDTAGDTKYDFKTNKEG